MVMCSGQALLEISSKIYQIPDEPAIGSPGPREKTAGDRDYLCYSIKSHHLWELQDFWV